MKFMFYFCSFVAVLSTLRFMMHSNPMHALLYLIVSLISISGVFFSIGAYFAGAMEVIVYAGAIMVLFVFVVMILNLGKTQKQERQWLTPSLWMLPCIFPPFLLLIILIHSICISKCHDINNTIIDAKEVGKNLFGPYLLTVEFASILLIVGLIVAFHIGREDRQGEVSNNLSIDPQMYEK